MSEATEKFTNGSAGYMKALDNSYLTRVSRYPDNPRVGGCLECHYHLLGR